MASMVNPYKESMRRLANYVGLVNFGTTQAVTPPPASGTEALYFQAAETPEWKSHIASLPPHERHKASVRRRLSRRFWVAAQADLCLWCWFSKDMCFCAKLEEYREQMLSAELDSAVKVTMVLHAAEVMRTTNSGHIAAFILGAPIRVWGVEEDDAYLAELPAVAADDDGSYAVSLYPEPDAVLLENFVQNLEKGTKVHLVLSDGTWGQATALNRHIPHHIPRVALFIDRSYKSLFKALRKQTRETGVSTLEATNMAMEQCLRGLYGANEAAVSSSSTLTAAMKEFVDLRCLLKYQDACFANDLGAVANIVERRDIYRREAALGRLENMMYRVQNDPEVRKLLLPPVLNYCYACDVAVGWHRMVEHALGKGHQEGLKKNPSCIPSEQSRGRLYGIRMPPNDV
ncbi:hypothetical protein DQ04_00371030 [Trypanosoma grayi]|uniref:hypothetical protein n=1 Tax=Trypanosoma grayi TaxID=71804 RepID=UPI0004F432F3|nr:hypothetical protein DQ04_00371030 [Trypanosoma grayi]KEG14617.1 hypothetical protein DQ04_00371030 [Trypanosoma grayi]